MARFPAQSSVRFGRKPDSRANEYYEAQVLVAGHGKCWENQRNESQPSVKLRAGEEGVEGGLGGRLGHILF